MDAKFILGAVTIAVFVATSSSQMPPGGVRGFVPFPPKPESGPCVRASDCGNSGCCLNGKCSKTGGIFDRCYVSVEENSRTRPTDIWRKTNLCPCEYTSYCWRNPLTPDTVDPKYGPVGTCMPTMG